jgi:hypothetical protein
MATRQTCGWRPSQETGTLEIGTTILETILKEAFLAAHPNKLVWNGCPYTEGAGRSYLEQHSLTQSEVAGGLGLQMDRTSLVGLLCSQPRRKRVLQYSLSWRENGPGNDDVVYALELLYIQARGPLNSRPMVTMVFLRVCTPGFLLQAGYLRD